MSLADRAAYLLASAGGAGYLPVAPGTWGSAVVVAAVYGVYLLRPDVFSKPEGTAAMLGVALALGIAGVWASDRVASRLQKDDPSVVVIDEVVGQLMTYSLLPAAAGTWTGWGFEWALLAGFLLFRLLDIVKPGAIDALQGYPGGLGIMADDFLAGIVGGWMMLVGVLLI